MEKLEQTYYQNPKYVYAEGSQGAPLNLGSQGYVVNNWVPLIISDLDHRRFIWGEWLKDPVEVILFGFDSQYRPIRLQMVGGEKVGEGEYTCSVGCETFRTFNKTEFENYLKDIGPNIFTHPGVWG
jgi:hypothetical protein